jgi:hypothetical protein
MAKTRPGADRIAMQLLKAAISAQGDMLRLHVPQCHTCTVAGKDAFAHCTTWWDIKTKLHGLQRKMGMAIDGYVPGQDTLPGLEQGQ